MKIWRTRIYTNDHGVLLSWHASRRAAEDSVRGSDALGDDPLIEHKRVEFPLTRTGLIDWLNKHFTSDNG